MNNHKEQKPSSIEQIHGRWNAFSNDYDLLDSTCHTFYYTLIHMLHLEEASSILEVGCGTAKLLSQALYIKPISTPYLAIDLSENMISKAKSHLQQIFHFWNAEKSITFEQWMSKHQLLFKVANCQQELPTARKFDRIICNLVLMLTEDPQKMLLNLWKYALPTCLLGITIAGGQTQHDSNFFTIPIDFMQKRQLPIKSNSHKLLDKLTQLASKTGWEVVIIWNQNAPYHFYEFNHLLVKALEFSYGQHEEIRKSLQQAITNILLNKQALNFPTQMAIFRKVEVDPSCNQEFKKVI